MGVHELKNISPSNEEIGGNAGIGDDENLARLGKKAVLRVSWEDDGFDHRGSLIKSSGTSA